MIRKEWKIINNKDTKPLIERLLSVRGITSKEDIKEFLKWNLKLIKKQLFLNS